MFLGFKIVVGVECVPILQQSVDADCKGGCSIVWTIAVRLVETIELRVYFCVLSLLVRALSVCSFSIVLTIVACLVLSIGLNVEGERGVKNVGGSTKR